LLPNEKPKPHFLDIHFHLLAVAIYPEQQLPGVPHELGVPQQLPDPASNFCDELLDVL